MDDSCWVSEIIFISLHQLNSLVKNKNALQAGFYALKFYLQIAVEMKINIICRRLTGDHVMHLKGGLHPA
jgi:hypothetical protein